MSQAINGSTTARRLPIHGEPAARLFLEVTIQWFNLRRELVNCAVVVRASVDCRTVEISGCIGHHSVVGKACVRNAGETINHSLYPVPLGVGFHLENGAATAARATLAGGSV